MSEEQQEERMAKVAQDIDEATVKEEAAEAKKTKAEEKYRIGYFTGLTKEGNFVFEVVGTEQGLVELLGIHEYAGRRVEAAAGNALGSGDRITTEVGRAVLELNQKVDALLKALAPQNKLIK